MSLLSLDISKCVHSSNKNATCNACVRVCPTQTIKISDSTVSFTPSECVGCGGCGAVCPTSAYSLDDFNPINFIFKFLETDQKILTCKSELPCIAALSVEELLSLSLFNKEEITLDIAPCNECPIAQTNLDIIQNRAQEINFLLQAMMQKKSLHVEAVQTVIKEEKEQKQETLSRRELLLKDSLKRVSKIRQQFLNHVEAGDDEIKSHEIGLTDIVNMRQKRVPAKRSLLLMAFKRCDIPEIFHTISIDDISFSSQKNIDLSTCTDCQMCYRICPTGALHSDTKSSFIAFNPLACVKCSSCHDVCEPKSLTLKPSFNLRNFFEPCAEVLIKFDIKRCDECGVFFAYKGGEKLCQRCLVEEEEARELWGIR